MRIFGWTLLCAAAEYAGIAVAALLFGLVAVTFGEPSGLPGKTGVWLLSTACGIAEGLILGSLQSRGIERIFAIIHDRAVFVSRTILAAVAGWAAGTFIPVFFPFQPVEPGATAPDPPLAALAAFAAVSGALAGALFGWLQAGAFPGSLLRRHWLIANTLGWAFGLPMIYLGAQIGSDLAGWTARIAAWAAGGALAGLAIGLATAIPLTLAVGRGAADHAPML